jgi:parallel beta-helix repeat protein
MTRPTTTTIGLAALLLLPLAALIHKATPASRIKIEDPAFTRPAENFDRLEFPTFDPSLPPRPQTPNEEEKNRQRAEGSRIRAELLAAATGGQKSFTIPPGTYRFAKDEIPVALTGVTGFSLVAKDVEFVLEGVQPAVRLERCRGVAIRGITVDRDPLPYAQFEVVSYDAANKRLAARFFEGYDPRSFPDSKGHLQFFHRDGTWVGHDFIGFASLRVSDEAERLVEFEGVETHEPSPWLQPGILGVTALRGGFHCIRTIECADITVQDFTNYGGMQIIFGELGDGDFAFRRIKNITRPGTNRLLGGAFGLMTVVGGNMRLEDSVFCRSNDDALDMVSWNSVVYRQEAPDRIVARGMAEAPYLPGDTLSFHDQASFNLLGTAKIVSVERIKDPALSADAAKLARTVAGYIGNLNDFDCVRLALDAPVKVRPGTTIANETSFRLDKLTLKNNLFFDIFCRVLVHGLKEGLIEGNVMLRCGMAAICVDNEQRNWAEGPCSRNVVIRRNVIKDSPFSPYMGYDHQLSGAISVGFTQDDRTGTIPNTGQSTRNITIEDNRIINPMYAGILVKNTDGLKIIGNTIENPVSRVNTARRDSDPAEAYYGSPQDAAIFLYACRNVTLQGNVVKERGPHCRREVAQIPGFARQKIGAAPSVRSPIRRSGNRLEISMDWNVTRPPETDARVFLQLVDEQGEVRAQGEQAPARQPHHRGLHRGDGGTALGSLLGICRPPVEAVPDLCGGCGGDRHRGAGDD